MVQRRNGTVRIATIVAVTLAVAAAGGPASDARADDDGLDLRLSSTAIPGEVRLDFSGKPPTFVVYRSTDPAVMPGIGTRVATTNASSWVDSAPPADELLFYLATSRPTVLTRTMTAAEDLAGAMETRRRLQDSTFDGSQNLNPAQFLHQASKSLLALTSRSSFPATTAPAIAPPSDPYPAIDLAADFFDRSFDRDGYLAFFRQIDDDFIANGTYPESWIVDGTTAEVRFDQAVYWAALLVRAWRMQETLPSRLDRFVISPIDLVPWDVPVSVETYTSALESNDGFPFFVNGPRRYYTSAAHQYELLELGREIYGNTRQAYRAGEEIYDWVMNRWQVEVGYSSGRTPFSGNRDGVDLANFFVHTSGVPVQVTSSIMRANGIPASISGAAYFQQRGWVNIDVHAAYGSDPLDNSFYNDDIPPRTHNMPFPDENHDFVVRANEIRALPGVQGAPDETRFVYVNPKDVLDYGAPWVLDHLGEFDVVVMTVKSIKGFVYFAGSGWPEREQQDALGPLIAEADARGKQVYVGFNTLHDIDTGRGTAEWRQLVNHTTDSGGATFPNIAISPCVDAYRDRLESLLTNLVTGYDVDGVVLESLYFSNLFGTTGTEGHGDCPTGNDWMRGTIRDYTASLAGVIRTADPSVPVILSAYPQGRNDQWPLLAPEDWGHQDMAMLLGVVDDVHLNFVGTNWVDNDPPGWLAVIDDYRARTGRDPWVTFKLTDEWVYDAGFYRGLASLARGAGITGFGLHTELSALGELGPALSRTLWEVVSEIDLP